MAHLAANKKNNALRKTQMTQRKMRCSANAWLKKNAAVFDRLTKTILWNKNHSFEYFSIFVGSVTQSCYKLFYCSFLPWWNNMLCEPRVIHRLLSIPSGRYVNQM
jgi:hypothetical protein